MAHGCPWGPGRRWALMGGLRARMDAPWLRGYYADPTQKRTAGHPGLGKQGPPGAKQRLKLDPTSGVNILK